MSLPLLHSRTLSIFLLCQVCWVLSFNLEPRLPIIKEGSPGSHFGFSVALHKSVVTGINNKKISTSWILVGAPKDHNRQPGTNRSGALWKCRLSTNTSDCVQVHTDGFLDEDGEILPPKANEVKDGQWLGVMVKSQGVGGDVLVCAHRYIHKIQGSLYGIGLCYLLDKNLDVISKLEPCRSKPIRNGHLQFGLCQAGISGLLLDDEVVIGVPGPYNWRGTVHTSNISKDFLLRDKTQYFGPITENVSPVDKYSYLGYSITAGRFLGDFTSYVGGGPRSNGTGQVVFFSRNKIGVSVLDVDLILNGETFASSFGFEVLAVDVNNNGWDDLLVSAPFYMSDHSSGAVYYYHNENGITGETSYKKIEGAAGESRFGFSMTSLGDLNLDGYKDVAIGAPYEDKGVIYIYLGSKDGLVITPSQVIRASDVPGSYNSFGYALSGGIDMDNNGYPDLLTSSFCSNKVMLIRSRPVIAIETIVIPEGGPTNIDPAKQGCSDDNESLLTCFSVEVCFHMSEESKRSSGLLVKYSVEERVYKDHPIYRVLFSKNGENFTQKIKRTVSLERSQHKHQCTREIMYLRDGVTDHLRSIRFKLTFELVQKEIEISSYNEGLPLPNIDEFPILDQREAVKYFNAEFVKDCGDDGICDSDLFISANMSLPWHESKSHQIFELGVHNIARLDVNVYNRGEPAYLPGLFIKHHSALSYSSSDSKTGNFLCVHESPELVYCSLGNPLHNETGPLVISFTPTTDYFDETFVNISLYANSTSNQLTDSEPIHIPLEIVNRAEISIRGTFEPEQVFYSGSVIGETGINYLNDIGSEISHNYIVDNNGPWRVDYVDIEILWPLQVENNEEHGKWLLYLAEEPLVRGNGECRLDSRYINALALSNDPNIIYYKNKYDNHYKNNQSNQSFTQTDRNYSKVVSSSTSVIQKNSTVSSKVSTSYKSSYSSQSIMNTYDENYDDYYDDFYRDYLENSTSENTLPYFESLDSLNEILDLDRSKKNRATSRRKRSLAEITGQIADSDDKSVRLSCTGPSPSAKCIPIICTLRNLGAERSVTITVKSRLWRATLVEDYSHVNIVNIQSRGEVLLSEKQRALQDGADDIAFIETKAYANLLKKPKRVPIWAIILGILAGLLILILIVLVMWKCGFFERRRKEVSQRGNLVKG